MKKLFGFLMMLLLVVPFAVAYAIEGNYYVYSVGDEVNFYTYEGDSVGTRTIILEDEGANSQYVRTLATGVFYAGSEPWVEEIDIQAGVDPADFKQVPGYQKLQDAIQLNLNGASYVRNVATETSLITLDDLINVFGATKSGDIYTIDWDKWGRVFANIPTSSPGLFTQTLNEDKSKIWAIKFARNAELEVTAATVELVGVEDAIIVGGNPSTNYGYMPVLYMDKTYDCVERESTDKFSCYKCGEDYQWLEVGTQADTCEEVPDKKSESTCVKNDPMGLDQYFIQFGIIAGICVLALVAVNRKDLFKSV